MPRDEDNERWMRVKIELREDREVQLRRLRRQRCWELEPEMPRTWVVENLRCRELELREDREVQKLRAWEMAMSRDWDVERRSFVKTMRYVDVVKRRVSWTRWRAKWNGCELQMSRSEFWADLRCWQGSRTRVSSNYRKAKSNDCDLEMSRIGCLRRRKCWSCSASRGVPTCWQSEV